jgi:hypothetical protein
MFDNRKLTASLMNFSSLALIARSALRRILHLEARRPVGCRYTRQVSRRVSPLLPSKRTAIGTEAAL